MKFYLICYDIQDNRRRGKIARLLEACGTRVQWSVFEAYLGKQDLESLIEKMEGKIDQKMDTVRIYAFCAGYKSQLNILGRRLMTSEPEVMII